MVTTMVAYRERLLLAMKLANVDAHALAKALDITYTGAKKAMAGGRDGTSALSDMKGEPPLQLTPQERAMVLAYRSVQVPARVMNDIPRDDPPHTPSLVNPSRKRPPQARKEKKR
jgi:hypothetical protein